VDAVDHLESSFNQMRGIDVLREALGLSLDVHDIDLDGRFQLPRSDYRFVFFLGTLYHLKNPYYVLENLASHADWCVLSTRIAQVTPHQTLIEDDPVAYLLDPRETNNDPTNYWIFSSAGLLRLLCRAGWTVFGRERIGPRLNSDPIHPEADERMFVLLKSRSRHPDLLVHALHGWYAPENDPWRWTAKTFALEVVPPADGSLSEFALRFQVPQPLLEAQSRVRVTCTIEGFPAGPSLALSRRLWNSAADPAPLLKARYPTRFSGGKQLRPLRMSVNWASSCRCSRNRPPTTSAFRSVSRRHT